MKELFFVMLRNCIVGLSILFVGSYLNKVSDFTSFLPSIRHFCCYCYFFWKNIEIQGSRITLFL